MKAAQIHDYGKPSVIQITDVARPEPGDDKVLVEVHAASVNPFDDKVMNGQVRSMGELDFPTTLGGDIAGVLKTDTEELKAGTKVFGQASVFGGGSGALAEFAVTKPGQIGEMPAGMSFEDAAALPLTGMSAIQGLVDVMDLRKGQRILILGGSGGIGVAAIQLAHYLGAYVITTVPNHALDFVKQLGADESIDYMQSDFSTVVENVDAVFALVGGESIEKSFQVMKKGGVIVSMVGLPGEELASKYGVRAVAMFTKTTRESLNQLKSLVEKGAIKPVVQRVFDLEQTRQAFEAYEAGSVRGKIVVKVR